MRLVTVRDSKGQVTRCRKCRKKLLLENAVADLDGPAFQTYYHQACAPGVPKEA